MPRFRWRCKPGAARDTQIWSRMLCVPTIHMAELTGAASRAWDHCGSGHVLVRAATLTTCMFRVTVGDQGHQRASADRESYVTSLHGATQWKYLALGGCNYRQLR